MNNILEKDIYKFIFYPHELSSDKFKYISNNLEKYADQIELLSKLKNNLKSPISDKQLEEIEKLIIENEQNEVILHKVDYDLSKGVVKLAAESPSLESEVTANTFLDVNNEFLLKINTTEKRSKIYFFSKNNTKFSKINLTINPSNKKFSFSNEDLPLETEPLRNIETVSVSVK